MKIQHGNNFYNIELRVMTSEIRYGAFGLNKPEFDKMMSLEYPEVDVTKFNEYYNNLINEITQYASSDKPFKNEWKYNYLFVGIANGKMIFGRYENTVAHRLHEMMEKDKPLLDGLLCKIDTYGWEVTKHENGLTKVNYFSIPDDGDERHTIFPIYVYKDYLILGNADMDKPSFINNEYFLYNAGKRKKS
jgi:hypothetical protein